MPNLQTRDPRTTSTLYNGKSSPSNSSDSRENNLEKLSVKEALELFPFPKFRKYQKEVISKVVEGFQRGYKWIFINAPTGFGKSAVNTVFARAARSFYATPQISLINQMKSDKYIGKYYYVIMGRQNYRCPFNGLTVNIGKCRLDPSFSCDRFNYCPYWKAKFIATKSRSVLTTFSYLVLEEQADSDIKLGHRELLILDESHSIDRQLADLVSIEISPMTLGWDLYDRVKDKIPNNVDYKLFYDLLSIVIDRATEKQQIITLEGEIMDIEQAIDIDRIERFMRNAEIYMEYEDEEWVYEVGFRIDSRTKKKYKYVSAKPVFSRRFAKDMLWIKADKFILSSATFLDINTFKKEIGIPDWEPILVINVPSTFPVENRPIIDATVGKLTKDQRDIMIKPTVEKIAMILDREKGNVAVHAHSYELAQMVDAFIPKRHKNRIIIHNSDNRNYTVEMWKQMRGKVFVSVRFEEGQDWKGDICNAQILLKVPYPDINDKRVARRLELKQWKWYKLEALKMLIQAYGRAVRSETDKERFYIMDESFQHLVMWAWNWIPKWFKEALPPHWNKDRIKEKIAEMKMQRKEYGLYKGWSDSMLKKEAIRQLTLEAMKRGLKI